MNAESVALILEGYFQSLRRLSCNRCDFWSYVIGLSEDVEVDLTTHLSRTNSGTRITGRAAVGYAEFDALLNQHVVSRLAIRDQNLLGLFCWDIAEYIQSSYRDGDSATDPFASRTAVAFNAFSAFHGGHVYLAVPLTSRALVIGFGARA